MIFKEILSRGCINLRAADRGLFFGSDWVSGKKNLLSTPGRNKLFRKNEFRTNGRLHENRGVKSFNQLRDEHISASSKRGLSYTGPADLVVWPGLCSLALAWTITKYAHIGVD